MQYYPRELEKQLQPYLNRPEALAIKGPRQAGKTTLLEHLHEQFSQERESVLLTFEKRADLELFEEDIENFKKLYAQKHAVVLIDEFQYAQDGGQKLKYLYDTTGCKFIITGSSSLELTSQTGKFMVGRLLSFELLPFSFREYLSVRQPELLEIAQPGFDLLQNVLSHQKLPPYLEDPIKAESLQRQLSNYLSDYLVYGGYPAVVLAEDKGEKEVLLQGILETYLLRDVQSLLQLATDNELLRLARFLTLQIGDLVVYRELSSVSGLNHQQVKKHLNILQETFVASMLRPYFTNKRKELSKNPKVFFLDLGMRNRLMDDFSAWGQRADRGKLLENFVYAALRRQVEAEDNIKYWRTQTQAEVDFVVEKGGRVVPIEVKSTSGKVALGKSLHSFLDSYKPAMVVVVTKDHWRLEEVKGSRIFYLPAYYL